MSSRPRYLYSALNESWSIEPILLLLVLFIATVLRFYHLDHTSLWSDEGNTWALLSRSFSQIARDAAADIHPPGYYWLLKLWTTMVGTTAWAMRSFSALLGVVLVYLVYCIGRLLSPISLPVSSTTSSTALSTTRQRLFPLMAALLAALNPFQIYYSQEARMYMLLAVAGAGLVWSVLRYVRAPTAGPTLSNWLALIGYVLFGTVGLWTHYSFPIVLLAVGLGYLWGIRRVISLQNLVPFILANLLVLLLYLPWLPTAVARVLAWPAGGAAVSLRAGVLLTAETLLVGPLDELPTPRLVWVICTLLLPILGGVVLYQQSRRQGKHTQQLMNVTIIVFWWLLPIGLMFGAGLFTDAFLKFLLTASPAWVLLLAAAGTQLPERSFLRWIGTGVIATGGVALAWQTLPAYYSSPTVRDNYAGIAAYLEAVGDPQEDLVILDAPGQQEVWAYYDPGIPTLALPTTRPADRTTTVTTLQQATTNRRNLYALFWATDEADPERLVETWLDQHAFKGLVSWQGNLRFAIYTLSEGMTCDSLEPPIEWGKSIRLHEYCVPQGGATVHAGDVALVTLVWQTDAPVTTRYKVTVQLLNAHNQVIAQRDSEPVGGSRPTDSWQSGEPIHDNHGVWIPVGTPPGTYRMILALYDEAGVRLPVTGAEHSGTDHWVADEITIAAPQKSFPVALLPVQHRLQQAIGPVTLLGYNVHRQDMAHAPETPLQPGDSVTFTFFWQAPTPLPIEWPDQLSATLTLGGQALSFPLTGEAYPTAEWQAGQVLQYTVTLPFDGTGRYPRIQIGEEELLLPSVPLR